ncbi:DctP family TRAP transporter solute-binding subunit [Massilia sp. LXY-6]|uniref:DctP family TRAP transporter solute-binding subunit n=1 Tax=Massilia sp. LXY-6 TaxID=3379823 RepID=UPI003EE367C6
MLKTIFKRVADLARPASRGVRSEPSASLIGLVIALLGACLLASSPALAEQPAVRELDIADYRGYLLEDHPVRQGMRKFAQLVEAQSGGGLRVRPRTDALPGSPAKQIAALQAGAPGAPALMLVASTGLAAVAKEFELLDLPFLVADGRQADALLDGPFGDVLLARVAPAGLVGLAWWENGFRQITSSGAPIRSADDLRGLKFRVIGEPVFVDTVRAMGANPVPLPFGELYEALKSRRVDAEDNFTSQILAGRLHEVQSSLTITNHSYSALVLVANAAAWKSLSPRQRRILQAAAIEAGRFQRRIVREEALQARGRLAQQGMAVNELAPAERDKLRALTAPLRARYFGQHGRDLWQLYQGTGAEQ